MTDRYWLCGDDCTSDCGACKGAGRPAAVPDPRFRDQLAEALRERRDNPAVTGDRERDYSPGAPCMDCGDYPGLRHEASDCPRAVARFVEEFVAAEVEARVQAAACIAYVLGQVVCLGVLWCGRDRHPADRSEP